MKTITIHFSEELNDFLSSTKSKINYELPFLAYQKVFWKGSYFYKIEQIIEEFVE